MLGNDFGMLVVFPVAAADLLGLRGEALSNLNLKRSTSWSSSSVSSSPALSAQTTSAALVAANFALAAARRCPITLDESVCKVMSSLWSCNNHQYKAHMNTVLS